MDSKLIIDDVKQDLETPKPLCRCCLSTDRPMKNVVSFQTYFKDLAGLDVSQSDALPQWICSECSALLVKATRFKYKMLRANAKLSEYLTRCAPFPIDAQDPELSRYVTPHLSTVETLVVDTKKGKLGFQKVLEHKKRFEKSPLNEVEISTMKADYNHVKQEMEFDDYEDNISLEAYRSTKLSLDNVSMKSISQEDLDQILQQKLDSMGDQDTPEQNTDGASVNRKKNKSKEDKVVMRRTLSETKTIKDDPDEPKSTIRKPLDLDPTKIKVITLNPEEQVRQRQEESKTNLKYPFQCHLCFKGFNFETKLQNHMNKHSPSRGTFECTLCQMYLPTSYSLSVHSLIHTRRYECMGCGIRMIDRASIWLHYRTNHEGLVTIYTCEICGKKSNNYKTHRGHIRNQHSGERPTCNQCGRSFVNKDSLLEHLQIHDGVKNYECSVCNKRFRTRTQIKQHQLKHSDVKQYYCVECDVRFKSEHNLKQHLLKSMKHKDKRSFKHVCPRCDKRYESLSSLTHHISIAHLNARPFSCITCGARLASRGSLHKHVASVHRNIKSAKRHVCHTCGKAFKGKSVLTNHVRTHTGEKPFECSTCGRKFTQRTAMMTHVKLVHLKLRRTAKIKPEAPSEEPDLPKSEIFPKEVTPFLDGYFYVPGINGGQQ